MTSLAEDHSMMSMEEDHSMTSLAEDHLMTSLAEDHSMTSLANSLQVPAVISLEVSPGGDGSFLVRPEFDALHTEHRLL